ncbi:MAG TPA: lycopene cyclase family protein [Flavobacterium sp.]|jgi:lycopene beta-cyclase
MNQYDYIIAGMGCAGLSLAMHLISTKTFSDKKVLLIGRFPETEAEKTWCYWENDPGLFEAVVFKRWKQIAICNEGFNQTLNITPLTYKMVRSRDFYLYCRQVLAKHPNFSFVYADITQVVEGENAGVIAGRDIYTGQYVFNSLLTAPPMNDGTIFFLQHFKGFIIKTERPVFTPDIATLMDFNADQQNGTAFFYVLPFSETEALVEYTVFSEKQLPDPDYVAELHKYIGGLETPYSILNEENGAIPMITHKFSSGVGNCINIGTAGGQTKASTGYTFNFIQKHSRKIVSQLALGKHPNDNASRSRFKLYDRILLDVLHQNGSGKDIFCDLFKKNNAAAVLKFLDEETTFTEELKIISSLPTVPFLKSAFRRFAY